MLFSVIIPVHNRAHLIAETIASVLSQKEPDFELIVVDDGSSDDLSANIAQYRDKVRLVTQSHKGVGAARNLGAQHAQGRYLIFLDSDDVWFPWTLGTYQKLISDVPNALLILGQTLEFRTRDALAAVAYEPIEYHLYSDYFATSRANIFRGSGVLAVPVEIFRRLSGFDEGRPYSEDLDFLMRCGECGPVVAISRPMTLGRRAHGSSSVANIERTHAGMIRLLDQEVGGAYPGGPDRRVDRQRLLCIQARAVSNWCLKAGMNSLAWSIYRQTFLWQLRFGHVAHLLKIPILSVFPWLRRAHRFCAPQHENASHSFRS